MRLMCPKNCCPVIVSLLLFFTISGSLAQEGVSSDELLRYAEAMNKIDSLKESVKVTFNDMVKSDTLMRGGRVYMDLESAKGDSVKISALNLDDPTLEAYQKLKVGYESLQSNFKDAFTVIIKEDMGAALYNKVRNQLKSDKELEARLNELLAGMKDGVP